MTRVLIADDHGIVRSGLRLLLERQEDVEVVAEAADGVQARDFALEHRPEVAILDVGMPKMTGLQAAREIRSYAPEVNVLILSMHADERYLFEALKAGASGYVLKAEADQDLVAAVRAVPAPDGGEVLVGGQTAVLVDLLASLGDLLPWMAVLVVAATFVLLFLAFGSLVLPVKAVVMNVLSLGASFGALVWIFQDGHLSELLGFTPTGTVEATQPILVLAIVFGLSMDYEVFLMSRIREQYDLSGDNTAAVAAGVQRTGGIITSAALLLLVVIGAFSLSGITFIKMIGVAMLIAIVVDATIVRVLLVPATMRLLGRGNWYAPGPLRRFYARYGIRESDGEPVPAPAERELVRTH